MKAYQRTGIIEIQEAVCRSRRFRVQHFSLNSRFREPLVHVGGWVAGRPIVFQELLREHCMNLFPFHVYPETTDKIDEMRFSVAFCASTYGRADQSHPTSGQEEGYENGTTPLHSSPHVQTASCTRPERTCHRRDRPRSSLRKHRRGHCLCRATNLENHDRPAGSTHQ